MKAQRIAPQAHRPGGILAHHVGSLGDTLLTIPSLRALRATWPSHRLVLLSNAVPSSRAVTARQVLEGDTLVDEFLEYDPRPPMLDVPGAIGRLVRAIRVNRFDAVAALGPSDRSDLSIRRDRWFFRACGIPRLVGFHPVPAYGPSRAETLPPNGPASEAVRKVDRLAAGGLVGVTADLFARPLLCLSTAERDDGRRPLERARPGRPILAMGPFANWPSKEWPLARFAEIGRRASDAGAEVVLVGGDANRLAAESLVATWGFGINACEARPRVTAGLLAMCRVFVGVDSGAAHLAAAMGTTAVVVSWAGGVPARWAPLGDGHVVLRRQPPCQACGLRACQVSDHPCLTDLSVDEVWHALGPRLTSEGVTAG